MVYRDYSNPDYKKARKEVSKRDNYQCQLCKSKKRLEHHHIRTYSSNLGLAFDKKNMILLCHVCHVKVTGFELFYQELLSKIVRRNANG